MPKLCIFDLDGTLVDTIGDLTVSLNYALDQAGFPALTQWQVSHVVGRSIDYMCDHAVPENAPQGSAQRVLEAYKRHYALHCCDQSRPYEGVLKLLKALRERDVLLAVASNKPHGDAVRVLSTLFPRDSFSLVLGRMDKFPLKPAPDALKFIMDYFSADRSQVVYVGDSEVDVEFAGNAGLTCASVSWGLRTVKELTQAGAEHIFPDPEELLLFLEKQLSLEKE